MGWPDGRRSVESLGGGQLATAIAKRAGPSGQAQGRAPTTVGVGATLAVAPVVAPVGQS